MGATFKAQYALYRNSHFFPRNAMALKRVSQTFALLSRLSSGRRAVASLALAFAAALPSLQFLSEASCAQEQRGFSQTAQAAQAGSPNGGYYALVIGIDNYTAPLNQLKTAVHDAQAVADRLQTSYGFQVQLLLDGNATRTNILNALNDHYRNSLSANDNFLIYYAGHGYYDREADKAYWLPVDAESTLSANRISADDLTTAIRAFASRHVLIVSDSCYSGDLSRGGDEPSVSKGQQAFLNRMLSAPSRTLLSSGSDEPVSDNGPDGHSIFAAAMLYALESETDPVFTAADLAAPIEKMVRVRSGQIPRYYLIGNSIRNATTVEIGDFVFVHRSEPAPVAGKTPVSAMMAFTQGYNLFTQFQRAAAIPLLMSACDGGNLRGCMFAGEVLLHGGNGVTPDLKSAETLLRRACEGKQWPACGDIAWMYDQDVGLERDLLQAVAYYRKACDGGDSDGCFGLAWMYEAGRGVGKNATLSQDLNRKAAQLAGKGCDAGDPFACGDMGYVYESGSGLKEDAAQSVVFYRKGCEGGDPGSCAGLARMYEKGGGVGKDNAQALIFARKACDGGSATGCVELGAIYEEGAGVAKEAAQAVSLSRKACDAGEPIGCRNLGMFYEDGEAVGKEEAQAVALYRRACDAGDWTGCSYLGGMYEDGAGVGKDESQAVVLYRMGCDGGDVPGCRSLGTMYLKGTGVGKDEAHAVSLYRKACDAEDQPGCTDLGIMYLNGIGIGKDEVQAVTLFRKECNSGFTPGCTYLGVMYLNGTGVGKDEAQAVTLFRKGCDLGYAKGCSNLGYAYEFGLGVTKDLEQAAKLYRQGCDGNDSYGCDLLKRLQP